MPYAVIQDGFAIFGTGATETLAVEDARQWVDHPDSKAALAVDKLPNRPRHHGDMFLVPCSEALAAQVEQFGGQISWEIVGGVAVTIEEAELQEDSE